MLLLVGDLALDTVESRFSEYQLTVRREVRRPNTRFDFLQFLEGFSQHHITPQLQSPDLTFPSSVGGI